MQSKRQRAKLSPPRQHQPLQRVALFERLTAAATPLIWVSGAPGSGKTTLVASYLERRGGPAYWYQVDVTDEDQASFYFHLCELAQQFPEYRAGRLSYLTPEYLDDIEGFRRRFIRAFLEMMPADGTLVFDNFQEGGDAGLDRVLSEACEELGTHQRLMVISRTRPAGCFMRLLVNGMISQLSGDELKLSLAEARGIAAMKGVTDDARLQVMHRQCDGWAAGIVLGLTNGASLPDHPAASGHAGSKEALFEYFAEEVFARAPSDMQTLLLRTALLQRFTASVAVRLSGCKGAESMLEDLYARQYFTERRGEQEPTYQYHPLFRQFLLGRLRRTCPDREVHALRIQAATLAEESGDADEAAYWYIETALWPDVIRLIGQRAEELLSQGRWQTLCGWIERLPAETRRNEPWMDFWLGVAHMQSDQGLAIEVLSRAYDGFSGRGDPVGMQSVACAVVDAYFFRMEHFGGLEVWIDRLDQYVGTTTPTESPGLRLRVHGAMLMATTLVRPNHLRLKLCAEYVKAQLESDLGIQYKLPAGLALMFYSGLLLDPECGQRAQKHLMAWMEIEALPPLLRSFCMNYASFASLMVGDDEHALSLSKRSVELAREYGLRQCMFQATYFMLMVHSANWRRLELEQAAAELDRFLPIRKGVVEVQYLYATAKTAAARYDFAEAARLLEQSRDEAHKCGVVFFGLMSLAGAAACYLRMGQYDRCLAAVERCHQYLSGSAMSAYEPLLLAIVGAVEHARGDNASARASLERAFGRAREQGISSFARCPTFMLEASFLAALQEGIESAFVTHAIRTLRIRCTNPKAEHWPWPIRIRTFGGLRLERFGVSIERSGKSQHRVLDLLKALVAYGGQNVSTQTLLQDLWPESTSGGDGVIRTNLVRLRDLLGNDDAVLSHDGRIGLNPGLCWVDTWALEQSSTDRLECSTAGESGRHLLNIYGGAFLSGDCRTWAIGARDAWRTRFVQTALRVAGMLESGMGMGEDIVFLYACIERESLDERLYQLLISRLVAMGRESEARDVFRRCSTQLSGRLGVTPSLRTREMLGASAGTLAT